MIEEIILAIVGLVYASSGKKKISIEEIIGTVSGIIFVVIVLMVADYYLLDQENSLERFIEIMLLGYLPMRIIYLIGG